MKTILIIDDDIHIGSVTNISHDLRTPLTAICGYLDLLEEEEKSENAEQCTEIFGRRFFA